FFVVSSNNLGGCGGSTGPLSENPETGGIYGTDFPLMTVRDWVNSQALLADHLGVEKWAAVVGGSLGGMQAMQWAVDFPERIANAFVIAAAARLSTQNIAFNEIARQAIRSDVSYHDGHYHQHGDKPVRGLMLARMLGHITYLSDGGLDRRFGRDLRHGRLRFAMDAEFEIESYLHHQGKSFVEHFDANSYMLMTKALDYFDPAEEHGGDLAAALAPALAKFVVLSFSSDWRFASIRSREIVQALIRARKMVQHLEVKSERGHDSFLIDIPEYHSAVKIAMANIIPPGVAA
ncbi:MAG: homoserine O-acetyltransferase MetX, partial [Candidatus Porifericomitaceae bacterium WSBS_2022_MAG_OTU9]